MSDSDKHYQILKNFEKKPHLTQREMADELGLSVGKTNYLIRAVIDKGWLKFKNFRKSDNKIGFMYVITPKGIANKTILTLSFLKRKSNEYKNLKEEIKSLKKQLNQ